MSNALVSVIIPCYNQAHFLRDAVESLLQQNYSPLEIIVVDDGSTDATSQVAKEYENVVYAYQYNQGLSAARNTGTTLSNGKYLIFLDADDWLLPNAIQTQVSYLSDNPDLAFVSGWHIKTDEWKYPVTQDEQIVTKDNYYQHLLQGNYIGMHAAVMYNRWVFDKFQFDITLKACEDYDLYLKITRHHQVVSHSQLIAAYRIHGEGMSRNVPNMYKHVLLVLERQQPALISKEEHAAFENGRFIWKEYYVRSLYFSLLNQLKERGASPSKAEWVLLWKMPGMALRYLLRYIKYSSLTFLKKNLPDFVLKRLHRLGFYDQYTPAPGKVQPGDFKRLTPFSFDFGFDRGGPVDRYYIEKFLKQYSDFIHGRVLEIGDNEYTLRYGGSRVLKSDILHIDSSNPKATFVGDLSHVPDIPSDSFDCIVFTQTLHFIYDFHGALRTCYRLLKPGGSLLLTVPGISHIDHGEWREYWLWAFTDKSMKRLLAETFLPEKTSITTYGNVYVASAFLYGMGLPEVPVHMLEKHDPSYQVIISVKATK